MNDDLRLGHTSLGPADIWNAPTEAQPLLRGSPDPLGELVDDWVDIGMGDPLFVFHTDRQKHRRRLREAVQRGAGRGTGER